MALNAKRRQKKMAKKATKRKARFAYKNKTNESGGILSAARLIAIAANSPIHQCFIPKSVVESGMGNVVISRKMPDGKIGFSFFLVDSYCLGVKDAFFGVKPQWEFESRINEINHRENFERVHPSCARKLIEEAVAYARDLGFNPHRDYRIAKMIFGDIDPDVCPMSFEFGQDGKPMYVAGPYDTPKKSKIIMDTLRRRCGEDGFHYLVPFDGEFMD
ncbi:MAG: hypothetical protein ACE5HX_08460 [bacterium]